MKWYVFWCSLISSSQSYGQPLHPVWSRFTRKYVTTWQFENLEITALGRLKAQRFWQYDLLKMSIVGPLIMQNDPHLCFLISSLYQYYEGMRMQTIHFVIGSGGSMHLLCSVCLSAEIRLQDSRLWSAKCFCLLLFNFLSVTIKCPRCKPPPEHVAITMLKLTIYARKCR